MEDFKARFYLYLLCLGMQLAMTDQSVEVPQKLSVLDSIYLFHFRFSVCVWTKSVWWMILF